MSQGVNTTAVGVAERHNESVFDIDVELDKIDKIVDVSDIATDPCGVDEVMDSGDPQRWNAYRDTVSTEASSMKARWARRVLVALVTLCVTLGFSAGNWANQAPKADAVGVGLAAMAAFNEFCKAMGEGEEGNILSCVGSLVDKGQAALDCIGAEDLIGCLTNVMNPPDPEEEAGTDKQPDYSLYRMGSALSSFYHNSMAPQAAADPEAPPSDEPTGSIAVWDGVLGKAASGGIVLGYQDKKFNETSSWVGSGDAGNDANYAYDTMLGGSSGMEGVGQYGLFGATLAGTGLDSTGTRDGADEAQRKLMGGAIMVAYVIAGGIDSLFSGVLDILILLNPFTLIVDAVKTTGVPDEFTAGMAGGRSAEGGPLEGLADFFADIYLGMVNFGWLVTIPIMLGLMIMGFFMLRRQDHAGKLKQNVIRITYAVVGLPLLGVTYTASLETMRGISANSASSNSTAVVLSTYVDFEAWANNTRLYVPNDVVLEWDHEQDAPSDRTLATVRNTTMKINGLSNKAFSAMLSSGGTGETVFDSSDGGYFETVMNPEKAVGGSISMNPDGSINVVSGEERATQLFTQTIDLLNRYMKGQHMSSASFESSVKNELTRLAGTSDEAASDVLNWFDGYSSVDALGSVTNDKLLEDNNPLLMVGSEGLTGTEVDNVVRFSTKNSWLCTPDYVTRGGYALGGADPGNTDPAWCNIAPLAMYNYLNSSFDSSGVTVFSPNASTSAWSRNLHASVNAVGTGAMGWVYWASSMILLGSFVVIGVAYALSMLFNAIKRMIQFLMSIPFAAVGFMAGIAKVIVYVIALILEIFGTMFIYRVVQEFLMVIPTMMEQPLSAILSDPSADTEAALGLAGTGAFLLGAQSPITAVMVITALASAGVLIFTIMAMKLRGSLISAADEAVTRVINKFLDTNVSAGSESGNPSALRQGVARGAGIAATHQLLNAGDDGGADDSGYGGGGDGDGPDGSGPDYQQSGYGSGGTSDYREPGGQGGIESMDSSTGRGLGMRQASLATAGGLAGLAGLSGLGSQAGATEAAAGADHALAGSSFDGDGNAINAEGEPMTDADGRQMTIDDAGSFDERGGLVDQAGNPVMGANGKQISSADIGGVDSEGNLVNEAGEPITDQFGNPVPARSSTSDNVDSSVAGGVAGSGAATALGDKALAEQVNAQGGLSEPGVGMTDQYGEAGEMTTAGEAGELATVGAGAGASAGAAGAVAGGVSAGYGADARFEQASTDSAVGTAGDVAGGIETVDGESVAPKQLGALASKGLGSLTDNISGGDVATGAAVGGAVSAMMDGARGVNEQFVEQVQASGHTSLGDVAREGAQRMGIDGVIPSEGAGGAGQDMSPSAPAGPGMNQSAMTEGVAGQPYVPTAPGVNPQVVGFNPVAQTESTSTGGSDGPGMAKIIGATVAGGMVSNMISGNNKRGGMMGSTINQATSGSGRGGRGGAGSQGAAGGMGGVVGGAAQSATRAALGGSTAAANAAMYSSALGGRKDDEDNQPRTRRPRRGAPRDMRNDDERDEQRRGEGGVERGEQRGERGYTPRQSTMRNPGENSTGAPGVYRGPETLET